MAKTTQEKAMIKVQAQKVVDKIGKAGVKKIAEAIEAQIAKYKAEKHISKKGVILTGLPSRNIGINKYLIESYKCEPEIAFKVVELIAKDTELFCVGFAPFGSLLYLPEDYKGSNSGIDFADLLK